METLIENKEVPNQDDKQTKEQDLRSIKQLLLYVLIAELVLFILIALPYFFVIISVLNNNVGSFIKPAEMTKQIAKQSPAKQSCGLVSYDLLPKKSQLLSQIKTTNKTPASQDEVEFTQATYFCKGDSQEKEVVLQTAINEEAWIKLLKNYCQIPCKGFDYTDNCARYDNKTVCVGAATENCAWYACQNICLTLGTPTDWVCQ